MKYLLTLILLYTAPYASERLFFLPDEADDALYQLKETIASAQTRLLIITPEITSRSIEKALTKAAKRGVAITLVTSGKKDDSAAALVRFASVDYRIVHGLQTDYQNGELAITLIRSDDRLQCTTPLPLSDKNLEHDIALLRCTDRLSAMERDYSERIIQRSSAYLIP
jgi:hypothetical protein